MAASVGCTALRRNRKDELAEHAAPYQALKHVLPPAIVISMGSDVQEIEQAIKTLPRRDVEQLREWIENFLEDQLELTDEFTASIDRGKKDIAEGNVRVREPEQT